MELERLKALLGIQPEETGKDAVLAFVLDAVQETILNYCNLDELQEGLIHTAYRMAVDLYRYNGQIHFGRGYVNQLRRCLGNFKG